MTPPTTEARLRDTLAAIANQVEPDPQAYPRAAAAWRRRERRRRLLVALLATIIIAVDVAIGLWALDHAGRAPATPVPVTSMVRDTVVDTAWARL
jgi:hypothetical protein